MKANFENSSAPRPGFEPWIVSLLHSSTRPLSCNPTIQGNIEDFWKGVGGDGHGELNLELVRLNKKLQYFCGKREGVCAPHATLGSASAINPRIDHSFFE